MTSWPRFCVRWGSASPVQHPPHLHGQGGRLGACRHDAVKTSSRRCPRSSWGEFPLYSGWCLQSGKCEKIFINYVLVSSCAITFGSSLFSNSENSSTWSQLFSGDKRPSGMGSSVQRLSAGEKQVHGQEEEMLFRWLVVAEHFQHLIAFSVLVSSRSGQQNLKLQTCHVGAGHRRCITWLTCLSRKACSSSTGRLLKKNQSTSPTQTPPKRTERLKETDINIIEKSDGREVLFEVAWSVHTYLCQNSWPDWKKCHVLTDHSQVWRFSAPELLPRG